MSGNLCRVWEIEPNPMKLQSLNCVVYDYKSGARIGDADADLAQYKLWAESPSEVCEAHRCLSESEIARLGIQSDTTIFLL